MERDRRSFAAIEDLDGDVLVGWYGGRKRLEIEIQADGITLGLAKSVVQDGKQRFAFELPPDMFDGAEHQFRAIVGNRLLAERTLTVPLFGRNASPQGWIDGVSDGSLYGWYNATSSTKMALSVDGRLVSISTLGIGREDVLAAGLSSVAAVGFQFQVPQRLQDGAEHLVEVRPLAGPELRPLARYMELGDAASPLRKRAPRRLSRAAVVCWDLGHNPAGRALVLVQILQRLYDEVELVGPLFSRFGGKVWPPIQNDRQIKIVATPVKTFADLEQFRSTLLKNKYDFVYLCKPRWPTLYLGLGLALDSGCGFALDIDDYELSFFKRPESTPSLSGIAAKIKTDVVPAIDLDATLLAHTVIEAFPLLTVSNIALQKKFGGTILRHARDERIFDRRQYNREQIRRSYGYGPDDQVVLFLGTIRRHKGVIKIAEAIDQLGWPRLRLCLIGPIGDPGLEEELIALLGDRVCFHKGVPFSALAATTLLADVICLPQEPGSEVAQFQIPAKISDALAMGIPVIVEDLPPFEDLAQVPGLYLRGTSPLRSLIARALKERPCEQSVRNYFLGEFSTAANAERLNRAIATTRRLSEVELTEIAGRIGAGLKTGSAALGTRRTSVLHRNRGRDIVFLWKQNDSGLFGRRSDMVVKYLTRLGFAGRVLQFDAAISLDELNRLQTRADERPLASDGMVYRNIVSRHLGLMHELQVSRYTLLFDNRGRSFLGNALPKETDLPDVIRKILKAEHVSEEALLWVCPAAFDFEKMLAAREFSCIVTDLIDDQRSFSSTDAHKRRLEENYLLTMAAADIVFANCDGVAQRFHTLTRKPIHVISNGAERISRRELQIVDLFAGQRDIVRVGYVGNLRDRIDVELLERIADADPNWRLILVGPTGGHEPIERLGRRSNVLLLGPQRHDDALRIAASFDVAIIPHEVGELTASMNPLKLYMYQMLGLPIVTTPVDNMTSAGDGVRIAKTHRQFIDAIRECTRRKPVSRRPDPGNPYWDTNIRRMIQIVEGHLSKDSRQARQA